VAPLLAGLTMPSGNWPTVPCTPSGTLKISAPSMFGRKVLVPMLAPLLQQHPQLQVEAVLSDRLVDLVEEGFDAALRTGVIADQRIVARPLRRCAG
jgi:DNA-binding transcriptional LysR family regulator